MSTFTNWNGPQGSDVRAKDMVEFANAYSELVAKLNQHIAQTAADDNVHQVKQYVEGRLSDIQALIPSVSAFITELAADAKYALKTELPDMSDYARRDQLNDYALASSLSAYLKKSDLSSEDVIVALQNNIAALQSWVASDSKVIPELTSDHITGMINAVEQINFVDKTYNAIVSGSDKVGVYYILGMLKDKAGTAYIRMGNTKPFSAVVNFACTPEYKGALSVTTDSELANLKFKIVSGTSADGEKHAYLAIQSTEWIQNFASTDGVGVFNSIEFDGAGINFIPVDSEGYKKPNGSCHDVCDCKAGKGFSFSELAITVLNKRIFKEVNNPYVTYNDITALDAVGLISQWPEWDEDTAIAINVPEGYHACDGTDVLPEDDVSDEFRAKYTQYPLVDYSVIKTKSTVTFEAHTDEDIDRFLELAAAVAALHGIDLYVTPDALPTDAKTGVPAIVADGDRFAIYVMTKDDGWVKYHTEYNDINKTVAAIATVMSAIHNADVFTIYNSVADLPTDLDVETGAMAIVYAGGVLTVYKYNGTSWEAQ